MSETIAMLVLAINGGVLAVLAGRNHRVARMYEEAYRNTEAMLTRSRQRRIEWQEKWLDERTESDQYIAQLEDELEASRRALVVQVLRNENDRAMDWKTMRPVDESVQGEVYLFELNKKGGTA